MGLLLFNLFLNRIIWIFRVLFFFDSLLLFLVLLCRRLFAFFLAFLLSLHCLGLSFLSWLFLLSLRLLVRLRILLLFSFLRVFCSVVGLLFSIRLRCLFLLLLGLWSRSFDVVHFCVGSVA